MQLSKAKIQKLELIASKVKVDPDLLLEVLLDVGLKKKQGNSIKSKETSLVEAIEAVFEGGKWLDQEEPVKSKTPEQKVRVIEEEALNKGWTYEQLWRTSPRYDLKGLIGFIDDHTTISEVTEKHIALIHERPIGGPVIHKFYNSRVEQPWITKLDKKQEGTPTT